MKKLTYVCPEIEMTVLEEEDVLTLSNPVADGQGMLGDWDSPISGS